MDLQSKSHSLYHLYPILNHDFFLFQHPCLYNYFNRFIFELFLYQLVEAFRELFQEYQLYFRFIQINFTPAS